ncbi:MAG: PDZ domain-containing protein, partial [Lysobacter spongiicola]|nr:PDZ domain-containing protein [Lysobacter spongiicola]
MHLRHPLVVPLAIALALGAAPLQAQEQAGQQDPRIEAADGQAAVDASRVPLDEIRRYVAVYGAVKQAYVEPVEDRELMQSAIRGLLLDLDPHSAYLEGDAAENFDEQSRGNYDGIGVEIVRQPDGMLRVIAPIDDTPAARAGVMAGDLITGIDGEPLTET